MKSGTTAVAICALLACLPAQADENSLPVHQLRDKIKDTKHEIAENQKELRDLQRAVAGTPVPQTKAPANGDEPTTVAAPVQQHLREHALQQAISRQDQDLTTLANQRDFRDLSVTAGVAVLKARGADDSSDTLPIVAMHRLLKTWNEETVGLGPFLAINAEGGSLDQIGIGPLFSFRRNSGAHAINFGVGYVIDRAGFTDADGMHLGDRSGLFFMLAINPFQSGTDIFERIVDLDPSVPGEPPPSAAERPE